MTKRWDRMGTTVISLFHQYDLDGSHWWRKAEEAGGVLHFHGRDKVRQTLPVPAGDAPECEWHEFFVLLEIRLKLMPRAA